jgi:Cd2+/Zn2+-exporting ATPase
LAFLRWCAAAERFSNHPIARALSEAWSLEGDGEPPYADVEERTGYGISATVEGACVLLGNAELMRAEHIPFEPYGGGEGSVIYLAVNGAYCGYAVVVDRIKQHAREAIARLGALGVKKTVMLTGDREQIAGRVAADLGLDSYRAELLPQDKVACVEELLGSTRGGLAFVGDGVNDAPVLARADVGIAMGALGSDAAIEAADVVLMDDCPTKIATAVRISRFTRRIVYQNIVFALVVKGLFLLLSVFHLTNMWAATFADVGVAVIAILNAMRTLRYRE